MPVQINEMVITVEVDAAPQAQSTATAGSSQETTTRQLIAERIEQVMDIMRNKNER